MISKKKLIVVGDRVLIKPDDSKEQTSTGIYLPQGVAAREKVQGGYVVKTGPGYPLPWPEEDEPWEKEGAAPRYLPLQAEEGDYALFLRKAAIDVEFEGESYLIVPQNAILLLERDDLLGRLDEA
ncbi:MAG: co-chaperone GroES [Calditrichaeota bacterium]|nr:MAG: co-chaperone GroES [Calditrichota bacterium]